MKKKRNVHFSQIFLNIFESDYRHVEYGPCGEEIEVIHRDTVYVSRDDPCAEQFVQVPDTTPQYPM